jgi:O-antigen ligase
VVNFATGWNLWDDTHWQEGYHSAFPRAVATLSNPAVLGLVLGVAMVCAVAVLTWDGPSSLRRPALVTLATCVPGLVTTMTRGSILATAFAVALVLLFGRWRLHMLVGVFAALLVLLALLPRIQATELYQGRVTNEGNISARAALQDLSLDLAAQKPFLGWGHGSFDEAKNTYAFDVGGVPIEAVIENTSHNTYLTILVEYGLLGLILFALPFAVVATAALPRVQDPSPERWLLIAALASLLLVVLGAMTFDLRFFSYAQLLPWTFLAILRMLLERPRVVAAPVAAGIAQP